jgi:hypothetical protein
LTERIQPLEGKLMTECQRRYRGIRKALNGIYPSTAKGASARCLYVLAAMIAGIVGVRSTKLRVPPAGVHDLRKMMILSMG